MQRATWAAVVSPISEEEAADNLIRFVEDELCPRPPGPRIPLPGWPKRDELDFGAVQLGAALAAAELAGQLGEGPMREAMGTAADRLAEVAVAE